MCSQYFSVGLILSCYRNTESLAVFVCLLWHMRWKELFEFVSWIMYLLLHYWLSSVQWNETWTPCSIQQVTNYHWNSNEIRHTAQHIYIGWTITSNDKHIQCHRGYNINQSTAVNKYIADKQRCNVGSLWQKSPLSAKSVHRYAAQETFRNAEPFRRAYQLSPMFK